MSSRKPAAHRIGARLSRTEQDAFDRLVETRPTERLARQLGVGPIVIDRLAYGGSADQRAVERVRAALRNAL